MGTTTNPTPTTATWSNQKRSRDRSAWALLVGPGDELRPFTGRNVAGVVAVDGSDYRKDGKWVATTYRLTLAPGARLVTGHAGWEPGKWREGLATATGHPTDTWAQAAEALGVSETTLREFLPTWKPKTAGHYDEVEGALATL